MQQRAKTLWLLGISNYGVDTGCCSGIACNSVYTLGIHLGHYSMWYTVNSLKLGIQCKVDTSLKQIQCLIFPVIPLQLNSQIYADS